MYRQALAAKQYGDPNSPVLEDPRASATTKFIQHVVRMGVFHWVITHIAPLFIMTSPITSYADQIYSIHKTRTSAGFSLDIPLIMLLASILKLFYWLGSRFDLSLLTQAIIMIVMQTLLLHVALLHRASSSLPTFASSSSSSSGPASLTSPFGPNTVSLSSLTVTGVLSGSAPRPYNFWQWPSARPYWTFLAYFTAALVALQVLLGWLPLYVSLQGAAGLAIEAILPLPQIVINQRRRGCKGFRVSVLANWLIGDAFKMVFFFYKSSGDVPWAFKLCGVFQACCDAYLGLQYYMFGDGEVVQPWAGSAGKMEMEMGWRGDGEREGNGELR